MTERKKILAIPGSTRIDSTNLRFINAIAHMAEKELDVEIFNSISGLPHFNPDDDNDAVAPSVVDFRKKIKDADGVLVCTPEYAMGLPGTFKNAIDWTVSSCEFSGKPVLAITVSTSGEKAHASLLGTLKVIEAKTNEDVQAVISFPKTKISADSKITDEKTLALVKKLISSFIKILNEKD